jgi:hypothetical protein
LLTMSFDLRPMVWYQRIYKIEKLHHCPFHKHVSLRVEFEDDDGMYFNEFINNQFHCCLAW